MRRAILHLSVFALMVTSCVGDTEEGKSGRSATSVASASASTEPSPRPASRNTPTLLLGGPTAAVAASPNLVLIATDDQRFDTMSAMPLTARFLADHGITFSRAFASNPLCCPARASLLTGGYSHTTGVYTNGGKYGGWRAFRDSGDEQGTIAVDLDAAGYRTGMFGKYLNSYRGGSVPPGWDDWAAFVAAGDAGAYYDYDMYVSDAMGMRRESYGSRASDYSTSVIRDKAMDFIRSTPADVPLFLVVTPFAVHNPSLPAPQDVGSYAGYIQDLPPSFNEADVSDKPRYIRHRSPVSLYRILSAYRRAYETLQSVDRMVRAIVLQLRSTRRLRDTLIVFTTDQGVAYGEHRWSYKEVPYEESIRTPMIVRYDAVLHRPRRGDVSHALIGNIDVAPTLADAAGLLGTFDGVGHVDGRSMMPLLDGAASHIRRSLLLEHLDAGSNHRDRVPSYCGVRTRGVMYVRYDTGEEELYTLRRDASQLLNEARLRPKQVRRLRLLTRSLCHPLPPGYTWG